jgi:Pvc16 N-terminal domain
MSSYEAVGAVSSTLKQLLTDRIDIPPGVVGPIPVTVGLPPDEPDLMAGPLVNLFLYRVCENGVLKNQDLPGRGDRGAYGHPPLALDLHYLLTSYGVTKSPAGGNLEDEIVAHWLLGSAMRILHDFPIITPDLETSGGVLVLDHALANAHERVKLTLQPISLEDLSKVWTALSRPFRASAAYEVRVVQIEARLGYEHAQPVGPGPIDGPHVHVLTGQTPTITDAHAAGRADALIRAGDTLVLQGDGLLGEQSQVDVAGIAGLGQITSAHADRLTVVIPDDARLQPGILELRLSHGVTFGAPPERRAAFTSNTVAFALVPHVHDLTLNGAGTVATITGNRLLAPGVECLTLIQGITVDASQFAAGSTAAELIVPVPAGIDPTLPARVFVRVNGVQSFDEVVL